MKIRWTRSTNTFSLTDTQGAAALASTSTNVSSSGNQYTIDFRLKLNDSFSVKDTLYNVEGYALDSSSAEATRLAEGIYKVSAVSMIISLPVSISLGTGNTGTSRTGGTALTVITNNPRGFSISVSDNQGGGNSALVHTDGSTRLADYSGTITTPKLWSGTGFGLTIYAGSAKDSKWGTGNSVTHNRNKYTGIPQFPGLVYSKSSAVPSGDNISIGYKAVAPTGQKAGNYSGTVIYTITGLLN